MLSCVLPHNPMDCSSPESCPWDFPGKNTGVGCHFLLHRPFFKLGCVFVTELYELFVHFGNEGLVSHIVGKYFLPFVGFFILFMLSFVVQKLVNLIGSYLILLLPWEIDWPKKTLLSHRMHCLCSLLRVLWYRVLICKSFWVYFCVWCWGYVLNSSINMWLSSFHNTTWWRD